MNKCKRILSTTESRKVEQNTYRAAQSAKHEMKEKHYLRIKYAAMTVTIKKTDTIEQMNRKIEKVMRAGSKTKAKKTWDIDKYFGKIKGVYGDGLEYQKKMRDEWER